MSYDLIDKHNPRGWWVASSPPYGGKHLVRLKGGLYQGVQHAAKPGDLN
jgi:hypothetical protein